MKTKLDFLKYRQYIWVLIFIVAATFLNITQPVFAAVSPDADRTFLHPSENGLTKYLTLASGSYTFKTDPNPDGYHWVEWYNTNSGGTPVATAHLILYDNTNFNLTANGWVRAEIYKSNFWQDWLGWEASYRWYITVQDRPNPPSSASYSNVTTTSATVSWSSSSGATSYKYQYSKDCALWGTEHSTTSTSKTLSSLSSDSKYDFRIKACNSVGCSDWLTKGSGCGSYFFKTLGPPLPPSSASYSNVTSTSASVSWSPSSKATSYTYEYSKNGSYSTVTKTTSNTSATLSSLSPDTKYDFRVKACNSSGCSGWLNKGWNNPVSYFFKTDLAIPHGG